MADTAADASELWLTEGIFDTIALEMAGKASRALLSCNNYPEQSLADLAKACADAWLETEAAVDPNASPKAFV